MDITEIDENYREISQIIREDKGLPVDRLEYILREHNMSLAELKRRDPDLYDDGKRVIAINTQALLRRNLRSVFNRINRSGHLDVIAVSHIRIGSRVSIDSYLAALDEDSHLRIVAEKYIGLRNMPPPTWSSHSWSRRSSRNVLTSPGIFGPEWLLDRPDRDVFEKYAGATITQSGFRSLVAQSASTSTGDLVHLEVMPVLHDRTPMLMLSVTAQGSFFRYLRQDPNGWNFWPSTCIEPLVSPERRVYFEEAVYEETNHFTAVTLADTPSVLLGRLIRIWNACSPSNNYKFGGIRAEVAEPLYQPPAGVRSKIVNLEKKVRDRTESDFTCPSCNNPLTVPKSIERGYGPHCWQKLPPDIRFRIENEVGATDYVFAIDRLPRYSHLYEN